MCLLNVQTIPLADNTTLQHVHLLIFFFRQSKGMVKTVLFKKIFNELFSNYVSSKLEIPLCDGLARESGGKSFKLSKRG